jgi:hypothetical protein
MKLRVPLLAILALLALPWAYADELKLKDGTKIVGTIVGFEESSFKVKTSYGFAVVQKDQVASINLNDGTKLTPPAKADPTPAAETPKPAEPAKASPAATSISAQPAPALVTKPPLPVAAQPALAPATKPPLPAEKAAAPELKPANDTSVIVVRPTKSEPPNASGAVISTPKPSDKAAVPVAVPATDSAHTSALESTKPSVTKPPVAANPASPPVAALEPIREQVTGNTYTNQTYGFQMYKPPTWQVIAGVPALLPGAIAAMGTNDQTTYLLVGQETAGSSVENLRDATQRRLRNIMDNFRPLGEISLTVSGTPAIEIRFRGGVDQHDWSGVAVFIPHGDRLFTIFGMTLADSDLVQIQENVIARAVSSLQFTKQ